MIRARRVGADRAAYQQIATEEVIPLPDSLALDPKIKRKFLLAVCQLSPPANSFDSKKIGQEEDGVIVEQPEWRDVKEIMR